jgi:hypothetical protein
MGSRTKKTYTWDNVDLTVGGFGPRMRALGNQEAGWLESVVQGTAYRKCRCDTSGAGGVTDEPNDYSNSSGG